MSDDEDTEYRRGLEELHNATNKLRKMKGQPPKPFVPAEPPFCSFCGKGRNEVRALVEGPSVYICDECVASAQQILNGD
jgi:hypothetical protein